jgi:hypothetical protein
MRKAFTLFTAILLAGCMQLMSQAYYNPVSVTLSSNGYTNVVFANQTTSVSASINNPGTVHIPSGDQINLLSSVDGDAGRVLGSTTLGSSLLGLNVVGGYPSGIRSTQVSNSNYLFDVTRFGQGAVGGGGIGGVLHDITIWPTKPVGTGSSTPVITLDSISLQVLYIDAAAFSVKPSSIIGLPSQVAFNQTYPIAVSAQNMGIGVNSAPIQFWAEVDQYGPVLLGTVSAPVVVNGVASLSLPNFNLQALYSQNNITLPANFKYQNHSLRIFAREQGLQNSLDIANYNIPPSATLPVSLIGFEGHAEANAIALVWETAAEENNHGFVLEKRMQGNEFAAIGHVAAKGSNERYSIRDMEPQAGANIYRLRQIDIDGTENIISNEIEVNFELTENGLSIVAYPNQFKEQFNIQTSNAEAGTAVLEMLDLKGQKVFSESLFVEAGVQTHTIKPSKLSAGMYIVRLSTSKQQVSCRVYKW